MTEELEEIKRRHGALEGLVRELERRLTMAEYQLNSVSHMGPSLEMASVKGSGGACPAEPGTWSART
jgi:hypothetical protein